MKFLRLSALAALVTLLNPFSVQAQGATAQESKRVVDKKFVAVGALLGASVVLDIESTFDALQNCPAGHVCREANPIMRPFVNFGRPATYAFEAAENTALMSYSYFLKKKGSKLWWVLPVAATAAHGVAGVHNRLGPTLTFTFTF